MTITEFLLARIGDDETVANSVTWGHPLGAPSLLMTYGTLHINPERVRAECEAKRRIAELHPMNGMLLPLEPSDPDILTCSTCETYWSDQPTGVTDWPCETLRLLALPYGSHPDYDEAWRP